MTWFPTPGGYEVFFNRDERRSRQPALAPEVRERGGTRYIAPLDGDFGGTWIAVNEHGLTLALENGYTDLDDLAHEPAEGFTSRGLLLLSLVDCATADELLRRLREEQLHRYRSFLLAALDRAGSRTLASWIHGALEIDETIDPSTPLVSSSFETTSVRRSRQEVFRSMMTEHEGDPAELHLSYHESHLPERGPRSVCMHRPEAHTVSFSRIQVNDKKIRFHYTDHSPCRGRRGQVSTLYITEGAK